MGVVLFSQSPVPGPGCQLPMGCRDHFKEPVFESTAIPGSPMLHALRLVRLFDEKYIPVSHTDDIQIGFLPYYQHANMRINHKVLTLFQSLSKRCYICTNLDIEG